MECELEALFRRYREERDLDALAALFDRVAPSLLRIAYYMAPDRAAAEDLLQETFLVVLQDAQAFEEGRRLVPWLVGILVTRARKLHRARKREIDQRRLAVATPSSPEEEAQGREFLAKLDETLSRIDEPYREVLRLHLLEECPPAEVARLLDRPASTVRTQLQRGLRLLRRLLPGGLLPGVAPISLRGLARIRKAVLAAAGVSAPTGLLAGIGVKKLALAVFGSLGLTALGLFIASRIGEPRLPVPETGPLLVASDPETEPAGPEPTAAGESVAPARQEVEPEPVGDASRYHPQPADGWLVEIVTKGEGEGEPFEPVPFAELCLFDWMLIEDFHVYQDLIQRWTGRRAEKTLPLEDGYRAFGRDYLADALGRVRVPRPLDQGAIAFGFKGDLWGRLILHEDAPTPHRMVLEPDVRLRVQVVDSRGQPLSDVPVSIVGVERRRTVFTPPLRTEGPEGMVEFRRVRRLFEEEWKLMRSMEHTFYVRPMIPLGERVWHAIDPERLPHEPIRLVLPPTGSVVVEVAGPHDLPPGGRTLARLGQGFEAEVVDGVARFPHVGLGLELAVEVQRLMPLHLGPLSRSRRLVGPGPTLAGEEIRFRFPADPGLPLLAGRAVDEQNRPLPTQTLDFSFVLQEGGKERWTFPYRTRTDREGAFLVPIHEEYRPTSQAALFLATPGRARDGRLALPAKLSPGRHEIGVIELRRTRVLLAGRLADCHGLRFPPGPNGALRRRERPTLGVGRGRLEGARAFGRKASMAALSRHGLRFPARADGVLRRARAASALS